jgi:hypothetical protein
MIHQHQTKANKGIFNFFSLFPPVSAKIYPMRTTDLKYLGYGFGIGALLASLFFAVFFFVPQFNASGGSSLFGVQDTTTPTLILISTIQPANTFAATETATATVADAPTIEANPTFTFTPTPPPSPTATLTIAEMKVASGEIAFAGPLTQEQQIKLYEASQFFIAPTYELSKKMSVLINQARFSDPNTTCGPLSIAILKKASILNEDLVAHSFFLINPNLGKDRGIINTTFRPDLYTDTRYKVRIDQFDWRANPLKPGDFVYIYSGTGGNFDHMLVVNRVDNQGRAYSVTNYNTDQGFVINEALLYDPANSNAGLFSQWTEKQFQKLGSTGYAGFEVWRLKESQ